MKDRKYSAFALVGIWMALIVGCVIVAMIVWTMLPGHNTVTGMKWLQLLQDVAIFLLPAWLLARIARQRPAAWLQLDRPSNWQTMLSVFALMVIAIPGINLLGYINQQLQLPAFLEPIEEWLREMEEQNNALLLSFMQVDTIGGLLANIGLLAVLTAIGEEITFRGVMLNLFSGRRENRLFEETPHAAVWVTAIIFSLVHFQFYGFVPRMLMGALFGYVLVWTGSLWCPILMHATNNGVAVIMYYVCFRRGIDVETMDTLGSGDTLWLGITSLVLTVAGIYILRRSLTIKRASSLTSSGN